MIVAGGIARGGSTQRHVGWSTVRVLRISGGAGHLLEEIVRFLVVGGAATLVSVIGFNALVHGTLLGTAPLEQHPIAAYVLVNVVGGCVAYLGMRLWAFSHREVSDPVSSVVKLLRTRCGDHGDTRSCAWR